MLETSLDIRESGGPNRIALPDFLSHRNPRDDYYRTVVGGSTNYLESPEFAQESIEASLDNPRLREFFRSKLKGEILVDCGGGREEFMKKLAVEWGAGAYLNLDGQLQAYDKSSNWQEYSEPFPGVDGARIFSMRFRSPNREGETEIQGIDGDMLRVVARFPDNSVNYVLNAIDNDIILVGDYWRALAAEIERTTKTGGVVFGYNNLLLNHLSPSKFKDTELIEAPNSGIFEKV